MARLLSLLAATAVGLAASATSAEARPQVTSGLTNGFALTDFRAANGPRAAYHLGGRVDVLFRRTAPLEMAIGPYAELMTAAFDTFESGGGVAWLLPTTGATAFVLSLGAFARTSRFGWEPGATSTLFWGSRGYNYHSTYALGLGLFAQGRYGLGGDGQQADAIAGVQIDLEYLALPFLFAYEAIRR